MRKSKKIRLTILLLLLLILCFYILFFKVELLLGIGIREPERIVVRDGNTGEVVEVRDKNNCLKAIKSAHVLFFYPILSKQSGWIKSICIKGDGKEIQFTYDGMYIINSENNMVYVLSGKSAENISKYIE